MRILAAVIAAFLSTPVLSWSQTAPTPSDASPKQTVVAGERYRKGGLYRWLFGSGYRDLWTTPFAVDTLDLSSFGGGLTPTRVVGHGQSRGLAFKGADGRLYTFRPLLKDPSGLLPVELRETFARWFVVDQMASGHPAGHVIVAPLYHAVGVTHNEARLVKMPDDPALGEFRNEFKGQLGDIEEFGGSPGIIKAEENIDGEELWKRTRENPAVRVDARAYLRARLVDQIIGDWDRHRNQWRWAKVAGNPLWQPIPEDRDQAFVRFNGLAIAGLRSGLPLLVEHGPKYSGLDGLTFDGWDVDRRLLAELPAAAYDEEAAKVRSALTDTVIEQAVRRMPPEFYARNGATLTAAIKARRDNVTTQAKAFYRYLSKSVDIYGTDVAEVATVERAPSGDVTVSVAAAEGSEPYFRRTFNKNDTNEIRLLLFGGNDKVVTKGDAAGPKVRAVGGDGNDVVDDSAGGRTRFYDSDGGDKVIAGKGTSWAGGLYTPPPANRSGAWIPPRDWGRRTMVAPQLSGGSDLGLVAGLTLTSTGYAFRRFPYGDRHRLSLTFSTGAKAFRGVYDYDRKLENSKLSVGLTAAASGYDILRFYGFGNETPGFDPDSRAKIENDQFVLAPRLTFPIGKADVSFELVGKYTKTDPRDNPLFSALGPNLADSAFSPNSFVTLDGRGQVGAGVEARMDTTDKPAWPSRGFKLWAGGHAYPGAWDLEDPFGEVHGEVATYLSPSVPGKVILMLRGGGKRVFGNRPYFESAFLGGRASTTVAGLGDDPGLVRGLRPQRFAGDGVLYGNAELRLSLGNVFILFPGELGIHGLFDVGRVYLEDDPSSKWHRGVGGGIWFASPNRRNAVTISFAQSEGREALYIQAGLAF